MLASLVKSTRCCFSVPSRFASTSTILPTLRQLRSSNTPTRTREPKVFDFVPHSVSKPASQPFKRSQLGLFQGKVKQYGNNVPKSKQKTRRTWLPNVQPKRFRSESLDTTLKLKVTTRALRSIKKAGGLDGYLLKTRHDVLGFEGVRLRLLVRDAVETRRRASADSLEKIELKLKELQKPNFEQTQQFRAEIVKQMREKGVLESTANPSAAQILSFISSEDKLSQPTVA
ncbi:hypothetical protein C8J56DRAFT_546975 [Mycena floridula]|nr:hypothetical protein C8J56DRAFT_546975 [Mycena floridula]